MIDEVIRRTTARWIAQADQWQAAMHDVVRELEEKRRADMGRKRVWMLICDGCRVELATNSRTSAAIDTAREEARKRGWLLTQQGKKRLDWCNSCWAEHRFEGTPLYDDDDEDG